MYIVMEERKDDSRVDDYYYSDLKKAQERCQRDWDRLSVHDKKLYNKFYVMVQEDLECCYGGNIVFTVA